MPRTRVLSILSALALLSGTAVPVALADPLEQRGGGSHGGRQGTSTGPPAGGPSAAGGSGRSGSTYGGQQSPATGRRFDSPSAGSGMSLPAGPVVTTANART